MVPLLGYLSAFMEDPRKDNFGPNFDCRTKKEGWPMSRI
jgi:hypothetical protein